MTGDLARSIATTDPRLLLPAGSPARERLRLVAALALPAAGPALVLALTSDDEEALHVLPLVAEQGGLRRAREGDGWAAAVADVVGRGTAQTDGFRVRNRGAKLPPTHGLLAEEVLDSTPAHEVIAVGQDVRVRVTLRPEASRLDAVDALDHLRDVRYDRVAGAAGDVVWADDSRLVAPVVGVGAALTGERLDEALGAMANTHLLGGTDAEPTFRLIDALADTLAGLHLALATPTSKVPSPVTAVTSDGAAELSRVLRETVSEAVLVTGDDAQDTLRTRRSAMRRALEPVQASEGSLLLPGAPFRSLAQANVTNGVVLLDPLELTSHRLTRSPAADVASLLRHLHHVSYGAMRRLVGMGESIPVERAATWSVAVREALVDRYRELLAAADRFELFDERLLLAFEIEAECQALIYAARNLSTWSAVPEVGLLDLLPPE